MRSELRFVSDAFVYVVDEANNETKAQLRNLSEHGLGIKADGYIDIEPKSSYVIAVIPEKESNLEKFQMEIESRWIKLSRSKMESGFSILVHFNEKEFKEYLEYVTKKGKAETSDTPQNDRNSTDDTSNTQN